MYITEENVVGPFDFILVSKSTEFVFQIFFSIFTNVIKALVDYVVTILQRKTEVVAVECGFDTIEIQ